MADNERFETILESVVKQYDYDTAPKRYFGEMNNVAILTNRHTADKAVLKVSNEDQTDIERSILDFVSKSAETSPAPFQLPSVIHHNDAPPYLLLEYVPGVALEQSAIRHFSEEDKQAIGRDIATFTMWETGLDIKAFQSTVEKQRGGAWQDWDKWFQDYLSLTDKTRFPTLTEVAREVKAIRDKHYPLPLDAYATQVIHGDLRLPNIALSSAESPRITGIFDFETMRRGGMAEEFRSLYLLGETAISAGNEELDKNGYPSVDIEKVKFWCVGRWATSLFFQIAHNQQDSKEYARAAAYLIREYPDADWSELDI
jgi:hypothetical protein